MEGPSYPFHESDPARVKNSAPKRLAIANDIGDKRYRWAEPMAMISAHYRARCYEPVTIRLPQSQPARALYRVDPAAIRSGSQKAGSGRIPITFMCPALPEFIKRMPDGRQVTTQENGTACTTYWRGGTIHRDPKEGPACHTVAAQEALAENRSA